MMGRSYTNSIEFSDFQYPVKFAISQRGGIIMHIGKYSFNKKTTSGYRNTWYCTSYYNHPPCKAKVHTIGRQIVAIVGHHCH
ncbi:unnamed protein product [Spodoptera exigua]|nr:unnamed protein product [Spodoptera exigua]